MKTHSEEPLERDVSSHLSGASEDGAVVVGVSTKDKPDTIVEAIDRFVFAWQCGDRPRKKKVDPEDLPFALGSLWGGQLVREFGWEWRMVTFHEHDDSCAPGVLSADRSLAVYPFHFISGCLDDSTVDTTIMLSFNMLVAADFPDAKPGEYLNVMTSVCRIVPRIAEPANKRRKR